MWGLVLYPLVTVAVIALVTVLHELAHAYVARLVGFRVLEISYGRGHAFYVWWFGDLRVTLAGWPHSGFVQFALLGEQWLRARFLATVLAGPAANAAVFGLLLGWSHSLGYEPDSLLQVMVAYATLLAGLVAVAGLVPMRTGMRAAPASDMLLALQAVTMGREAGRQVAADGVRLSSAWTVDAAFLQGRVAEALARNERLIEESEHPFDRQFAHALMLFVHAGVDEALACNELARAGFERWVAEQPSPEGAAWKVQAQQVRDAARINEAFFRAQTGDAHDLQRADELLGALPDRRRSWSQPQIAELRTKGLVRLHQGRTREAVGLLGKALIGYEPYWLRALTMAYLALAHEAQGDVARSVRAMRRARTLDPHSPLFVAVERSYRRRHPASGRDRTG